jgi:threonine dehydratase
VAGLPVELSRVSAQSGARCRSWPQSRYWRMTARGSLRAGVLIANEAEPATIADGARTLSLGRHNWAILREGLADVIEVTEDQIKEAVRLLFHLANLKAEPTGALAVAALLAAPERFRGRAVCCVASGGNVDVDVFRALLG